VVHKSGIHLNTFSEHANSSGTLLASGAFVERKSASLGHTSYHHLRQTGAPATAVDSRREYRIMKAETRRKLEMGARALEFSRAHPDESPGYNAALAQLEEQVTRSIQLATQQREGIVEVRGATARKRDLQRGMRRRQLVHLARVAERAAKELPELNQKFALPREPIPYLAFTTMARSMVAEAQRQKELLIRHGLVERVLDSLVQSLDQFDQAVARGAEGRRKHVGAVANLDVVADEIVQLAKVMDGLNRFRFADDPEAQAAWKSASNVTDSPRSAEKTTPTSDGEVKPAA
jgi:hypothetical protein